MPAFAQLKTFAIQPEAAGSRVASELLIPGAGSVQGANGTFFHSDITVLNYRNQSQRVRFLWMPAGQTAADPIYVTIPANTGIVSEDFVASILHQSGLGALLISGYDAAQDFADPGALLYATERIWTPQPGTNGTTSQTFPAVATADINQSGGTILGQRMDNRYRTNVGIVNLDPLQSRQFNIVQSTDDPTNPTVVSTVTVLPRSLTQVPLPFSVTNALQIFIQPASNVDPRKWVAYGSSVDNVTGDSWSSLAFSAQ